MNISNSGAYLSLTIHTILSIQAQKHTENSTGRSQEHDSVLCLKVIYCSVKIICTYSTHTNTYAYKRDVKGAVVVGSSAPFENVHIPEPQP